MFISSSIRKMFDTIKIKKMHHSNYPDRPLNSVSDLWNWTETKGTKWNWLIVEFECKLG